MDKQDFIIKLKELSEIRIKEPVEVIDKFINELADKIFEIKKICSRCKLILPKTEQWFASHPHTRDKLQSRCRDCANKASEKSTAKKEKKDAEELDYTEPQSIVLDYFEADFEIEENILDYPDYEGN